MIEKMADVETWESRMDINITRYTMQLGKQPFMAGSLERKRIYEWLCGRWYTQSRADVPEMLEILGLEEYNIWEIVKKNTWN